LLDPLTIEAVGLAAGDMLELAGFDEAGGEVGLFEHFKDGDPIDAGGFHGDGVDATLFEPGDEAFQIAGEGAEAAHGFGVAVGWDGGPNFLGANIEAGGVGVEHGQR